MPLWRRRRDEPAEPEVAPETPVSPEDVEPGWEPDPADFGDDVASVEAEPVVEPEPDRAPEPVVEPEPDRAPEPVQTTTPEPIAQPAPIVEPEHVGSLDAGLERTRGGFMARLRGVIGAGTEDPAWDDVEETLIAGDVGAELAMNIVDMARLRHGPDGALADVRTELASRLVARNLVWMPQPSIQGGPAVVLIVGVNGTGKTTTIGKLASRYSAAGHSVILAAADTFRAAAIDQLRVWADRAHVPVVAHAPGADPGAVVYDALDAAVARGADIVIADTAGRLHTKSNLMDELTKIRRIIDKRLPGAQPGDAVRARRHDRPERAGPGEGLPRGGRADRDRADQARFDGQGRHRLRHRGQPQDPGPVRRGGGAGRRPPALRPGRLRGGALRVARPGRP